MSEPCILRQGIFDRWFILHPTFFHPANVRKGWSGSSWVPCTEEGVPAADVQVCNFTTEQEARDYCREHGLEPAHDA